MQCVCAKFLSTADRRSRFQARTDIPTKGGAGLRPRILACLDKPHTYQLHPARIFVRNLSSPRRPNKELGGLVRRARISFSRYIGGLCIPHLSAKIRANGWMEDENSSWVIAGGSKCSMSKGKKTRHADAEEAQWQEIESDDEDCQRVRPNRSKLALGGKPLTTWGTR
jgi:hypothetical protein